MARIAGNDHLPARLSAVATSPPAPDLPFTLLCRRAAQADTIAAMNGQNHFWITSADVAAIIRKHPATDTPVYPEPIRIRTGTSCAVEQPVRPIYRKPS